VSWDKHGRKWQARITHGGKTQGLGLFAAEADAARAVDAAARRLRGGEAHGGRAGKNWHRLNFPTAAEEERGKAMGMLTAAELAAAKAAAQKGRTSGFAGVTWSKKDRKWRAGITHGGKLQGLGRFADEAAAARAFDAAARRLRGNEAHGGRSGPIGIRWRLNFPTTAEAERAEGRGLPEMLTAAELAAAKAAALVGRTSGFAGVSWSKQSRKWEAQIRHSGTRQHLGLFADEAEAARAVEARARELGIPPPKKRPRKS
jgi:hypothetical protein